MSDNGTLSREDKRRLRDGLVAAFGAPPATFLADIGLPPTSYPPPRLEPQDAWLHVIQQIDAGGPVDFPTLLAEATRHFPRNGVLAELRDRCTPAPHSVIPPTPVRPGDRGYEWDLFVSFTALDVTWAEWIAWVLEESGYRVLFQKWDFVGGTNWVGTMQDGLARSHRLIAVLSEAYRRSAYGALEWQAMLRRDPRSTERLLLPVRVKACGWPELPNVVGCDLLGLNEKEATTVLLQYVEGAERGRLKPATRPPFPAAERAVPRPVAFPGDPGSGGPSRDD